MNRQIRWLAGGLCLCFLALFVQLNWLQVVKADDYNSRPDNNRAVVRDFSRPRGTIETADGVVVAESVASNDRFRLQRQYPTGDLFANVVGTFSFVYGSSGVEHVANDDLAGQTDALKANSLAAALGGGGHLVGDVTLTLRSDLQQTAKDALGEREGSVVAIDPRSGAVLAMWSWPSYDPNVLSSHAFDAARQARELYLADPRKPLLANAYQERYFPGSTFKIVTATAGLDSGAVTANTPVYDVRTEYIPPLTTNPIKNFGGAACGGPLDTILRVSCNTAFAQMGVDLGPKTMVDAAQRFGFNQNVPTDLPSPAQSDFPTENDFVQDTPKLAQSAIGQNDVQATPLEMALVACAVANEGIIMTPHVISEVHDSKGKLLRRFNPTPWRTAMKSTTATTLKEAMIGVVRNGTATRLSIGGVVVAGKTGTAQLGTTPPSSHAWVVGFAPADNPVIAVAVLVKAQPGVSEVTGGAVAAPIARQVLVKALAAHP
jgi:peptidoglycan glycosyltransferase